MYNCLVSATFVAGRYLHIIFTALLVGGTLFYLWVVPTAIADLKEESKLAVFGRARWMFRRVVFSSVIILLISGAVITARNMWLYRGDDVPILRQAARLQNPTAVSFPSLDTPSIFERRTIWFVMHAALGLLCIFIAVGLVRGGRPPVYPIAWMKLNFVLLLLVIFLAVMVRNAGKLQFESLRTPPLSIAPAASQP